jgi:hypothetical protein
MAVVTITDTTVDGSGTAPDAPTGLSTETEWDGVRLHWTNPTQRDVDYIEVWRATTNNRASATMVAQVKGNDYVDHSLETGTRYYWLRSISTTGVYSVNYHPSSATAGVSGVPDQVDPTGAVDKDVLQYNSSTNTWTTGALRDATIIKGALQATTNSAYSFPGPALSTTTNNNGLDAVSSFDSTGNGNGVQGQFTHYFGDTAAGGNTTAVFAFNTANGNSTTSGTLPWTGLSPTSPSAVTSASTMGGLNFNGYATTDFSNRIGTNGQGGGFNAIHALQFQGVPTETFANGTLTIGSAAITATPSRINTPMTSVTVSGTKGQISFSTMANAVGQAIVVTGTNSGNSTGISAGTYYIIASSGSTSCQLSTTPGGAPINTTGTTTTGLSFARQFMTVTYSAQSYIPFGLNAKVTISGFNNVPDGTYMCSGTSTTTSVSIGAPSSGAISLSGSQSISCSTMTNMGAGFRIRAVPAGIPANSGNRLELVNHNASSATYRTDSLVIAGGTYGTTGTTRVTIDANKAAFAVPVAVPAYTVTALRAITGAVGWMAAVSDNEGRLAYWNTTSSNWKYVISDVAV